jgi:hypothetical protein
MAGNVTAPPTTNPATAAETTRVPDASRALPPRELSPVESTSAAAAVAYGVGRIVNTEA